MINVDAKRRHQPAVQRKGCRKDRKKMMKVIYVCFTFLLQVSFSSFHKLRKKEHRGWHSELIILIFLELLLFVLPML